MSTLIWSPIDENSIPTPREAALAGNYILLLEKELAATLERAQELRSEIYKRRAWLSPVRRAPAEVLSLIFVEASREDWGAPATLQAVCRYWRAVILRTPRAWAFLLSTPTGPGLSATTLDQWMLRCGAQKLHVSLEPAESPAFVEALCHHEKRDNIVCLSLFNNSRQLLGSFEQLEELRLGPKDLFANCVDLNVVDWVIREADDLSGEGEQAYVESEQDSDEPVRKELEAISCVLSLKRFPKLIRLHLHGPSLTTMSRIAHKYHFPPLQTLHIHSEGHEWLHIIEYCADSLVELTINVVGTASNQVPTDQLDSPIILPRLELFCYLLNPKLSTVLMQLPRFVTPTLQRYHEANGSEYSPLHHDVPLVAEVFLQDCFVVDWLFFPSVNRLRLRGDAWFIEGRLAELGSDEHLCPDLTFVECIPSDGRQVYQRKEVELSLRKRLAPSGNLKELKHSTAVSEVEFYNCFTFCNCDSQEKQSDAYYEVDYASPEEEEEEEEEEEGDDDRDEDECYNNYCRCSCH